MCVLDFVPKFKSKQHIKRILVELNTNRDKTEWIIVCLISKLPGMKICQQT